MTPMKVVILTTSYPRHEGDVAGLFVRDAVEDLRAVGVEIEVVRRPRSATTGSQSGMA